MLRRAVWVMVGLATLCVVALMLTTPTPSKDEPGIFDRLIPAGWFE